MEAWGPDSQYKQNDMHAQDQWAERRHPLSVATRKRCSGYLCRLEGKPNSEQGRDRQAQEAMSKAQPLRSPPTAASSKVPSSGSTQPPEGHPGKAEPSRAKSRLLPNMPKLVIPSATTKFPPEITVTPPTPTLLSPKGSISEETKQKLKVTTSTGQRAPITGSLGRGLGLLGVLGQGLGLLGSLGQGLGLLEGGCAMRKRGLDKVKKPIVGQVILNQCPALSAVGHPICPVSCQCEEREPVSASSGGPGDIQPGVFPRKRDR